MIHHYKISGMSCDGCRKKVENTLNTVRGVSAEVSLTPPEATITMDKHVATEELQQALSAVGDYQIEMIPHSTNRSARLVENHQHDGSHTVAHEHKPIANMSSIGSGVYYCPMHCEGE